MGAGASSQAVSHRSLNCREATVVEFVNNTDHVVITTWLDYSGTPRSYFALAPGGRVRQPTFTAHPWTFVSEGPKDMPCVVDGQPVFYAPPTPSSTVPQQAHIRLASPLPWSLAHHLQFPADFQALVAALLLCHRRLSVQPVGGPTSMHWLLKPWQWRQQLSWLRYLCPNAMRALPQLLAAAVSPTGGPAINPAPRPQEQHPNLGDLPKDLLLAILAAAAPCIPLLAKPPLPHSVDPQDLPQQAVHELFEVSADNDGSEHSSNEDADRAEEEEGADEPAAAQ